MPLHIVSAAIQRLFDYSAGDRLDLGDDERLGRRLGGIICALVDRGAYLSCFPRTRRRHGLSVIQPM